MYTVRISMYQIIRWQMVLENMKYILIKATLLLPPLNPSLRVNEGLHKIVVGLM